MRIRYLVAVVMTAALAVTTATPASSATKPQGPIIHDESNRCLDGSISGGVTIKECNGGPYQQWHFLSDGDPALIASGLCLDGSISRGVRVTTCNDSVYQEWFSYYGSSQYHNKATGLCLDASVSQGVSLKPCSRSEYQWWILPHSE